MKFIEEVVVDEFLPTFRSMLAADLRERGLTQTEVATLLGISQSAVSKYAHGGVEQRSEVATDERVREFVEGLGAGLASGEMSRVQALVEAEVFVRQLERGDLLAALHEEAMPELAAYDGDFSVHDADSTLRVAEQVLGSVRRGVRAIENASGFATLIPAVGSNLVECLPDASRVDDVAGIPGRIVDVKGRASVPASPEFGASEHAARVLLAARTGGSDARAALNVRYTPDIVDGIEAQGLTAVTFDPDAERDDEMLVTAIEGAVAASDTPVDVLYQTGGFGIEPVVYVLAPDAPTAVERVRELL